MTQENNMNTTGSKEKYTLMVPELNQFLGTETNKTPLGFNTTDLSNTGWMNFLIWMLYISIFIFAAYRSVVVAGLFVTGIPEKRKEGKEALKKVVLGVIFVLAMSPLLNWLRPSMQLNTLVFPGTKIFSPQISTQTNQDQTIITDPGTSPTVVIGDTTNRQTLKNAGINIKKDNCTFAQWQELKPSCTSLEELPQETVNMLIDLKNKCKCSIQITGGTEPGHSTHGRSRYPVDLHYDTNSDLNKYLTGPDLNKNPYLSFCYNTYGSVDGYVFCDEKSTDRHWHVCNWNKNSCTNG